MYWGRNALFVTLKEAANTYQQEMTMRSAVELALTLREENLSRHTHDIIKDVAALSRLERKLQKLAESACNGFPVVEIRDGKRYEYSQLTEEQQKQIDEKRAAYTAK